ncbi:MAG: neutral zinc metallopeptidase, partial [Flavisolibacter sp.]
MGKSGPVPFEYFSPILITRLFRHVFYVVMGVKLLIMLWQGRSGSSNVSDRRGIGGGGIAVGGGILGVIALVINYLLGGSGDGSQLPLPNQNQPMSSQQKAEQDSQARFVSVVLKETEDVWNELFTQAGQRYNEPTLVLFNGYTTSACGQASSATGPFYCPGDEDVYIDLSFYDDL